MTQVIEEDVILASCPLVAAPQSGMIAKPPGHGTRIIAGHNGLYREVSTPWLYSLLPASAAGMVGSTPYGQVTPEVQLRCGRVPVVLVAEFLEQARNALPNESAALIVWNTATKAWRLAPRLARFANDEKIDYDNPKLDDDEVAVVDIHSHGTHAAFFSFEDDEDDAGGLKLSVVLGRVDRETEIVARLVAIHNVVPMQMKPDGEFVIAETRQ